MRPLPILGTLFNSENGEYQEFATALKERINLETACGYKQCAKSIIESQSLKFDSLFKDYFPSLTDEECAFETDIKDNDEIFQRKCLLEMYNVGDCPMVVEVQKDFKGDLPDISTINSYCHKENNPKLFYPKKCELNEKKNCVDQIYYTKMKYPFEEPNKKIQDMKNKWYEKKYDQEFGSPDSFQKFPSRDKYIKKSKYFIDYYNQISLTKELEIPKVDLDIIYINFKKTSTAFMFEEDNYPNLQVHYRGGDGIVQNWSPLLTGLKWIYDAKKKNLPYKIRLVEMCSRLAKDSRYAYNPAKKDEQKFIALSCQCITDSNNYDKPEDCGHGPMISDKFLVEYVANEAYNESDVPNDRIELAKNFVPIDDYEQKCNEKLLDLFNSDI